MANTSQNQLIADLSRDLVATLAPHELPLFHATTTAYFKNPEAVFKFKPGKESALGFGETGDVIALTPAILAIMTPVVTFVAEEMAKPLNAQSNISLSEVFTPPTIATQMRVELLARLNKSFSYEELRTLCFNLNIDYDAIGGTGEEAFARELILYCERIGRMADLLQECQKTRPNITWNVQPQKPPLKWTSDQLKRMRDIVVSTAKRANLPDNVSAEIADKLVLSLVTM